MDIKSRFDSKYKIDENNCWIWTAGKSNGYGVFFMNKQRNASHRVAWELYVGEIPDGLVINHYRNDTGPRHAPCRKACVNPEHLELTTRGGNVSSAAGGTETHCPAGHLRTKENSTYNGCCRECKNKHSRDNYITVPKPDSCSNGHPYTDDNTRYTDRGRACLTCANINSKKTYHKNKGDVALPCKDRVVCKNGHPIDKGNPNCRVTVVKKTGRTRRTCIICAKQRQHDYRKRKQLKKKD